MLIELAVFLFLAVWIYVRYYDHDPLDIVPGPRRLPIIGSTLEFVNMSPRSLFVTCRYYNKTYGDRFLIKIFRRRILHVHKPDDVELVLSHSKNLTKSKPYQFLQPWLGTGLLLSTGTKWFERRRILTPTFHFNILKNFTSVIQEKSRNLVDKLIQSQETELSLFPLISDFTLYTICETAMGTQLDQDQSSATVEYKTAIIEIGHLLLRRLTKVWLHSDLIFKMSSVGKRFHKSLLKVHSFADNVILERKKNMIDSSTLLVDDDDCTGKRRLVMLDLLLEAERKGKIDLEGIKEEVNTFMFEGHDTTATAITCGLMLLADHDHIQEQIYEECQSIFGDTDRTPTMSDLANMKYLEAVVKETMRLYPSVPFIAREITEDFMMEDLPVGRGTEVAVHIYDLHRREDLFPDPEAFKPERFLDETQRHPFAFVPFSAGPRNCIGQRFAMLEMKCALSEICRNFKMVPRTKGWRPNLIADMVLRSADDIFVKFIRRK